MTFGNMGEFSELTALKSSGIPLNRIMRPLVLLIAVLSIVSFFFSNNVLPYSNRQARTLLYDIRRKRPDINLQAGTFNNDIEGFSIKITSKDPVTNRLNRLYIYDHRENRGNSAVTYADSGYMRVTSDETAMIMVLYSGYSYTDMGERSSNPADKKYPFRKDYFKEQTLVIPLSGFDLQRSEIDLFKSHSAMLNISQLTFYIDSLNKRYTEKVDNYFTEYKTTALYSGRASLIRLSGEEDTLELRSQSDEPISELYNSLPLAEKRNVLLRAIQGIKEGTSFLASKNESLHIEIRNIKNYEVNWNKKFTLSFACIVFFFIGAPLGAIIRKGGLGTPAVISILFFVIWYVISLSGEKLAKENLVSTFAGMWAASYILLPAGLFLTYKASNDSVIMNIDTYLLFFKKIKDYIYRIVITGAKRNPAFEKE